MNRQVGRQTIAMWMFYVGLFAGGLAAIRSGSNLAEKGIFTLTLAVLSIGFLGAIVRRGNPAWLGFALFGWGSLIIVQIENKNQIRNEDRMITTALINELADRVQPEAGGLVRSETPAIFGNMRAGSLLEAQPGDPFWATLAPSQQEELVRYQKGTVSIPRRSNAKNVMESMFTILCALSGTIVGRLIATQHQLAPQPPTPG